jgi:transcriptional regulator GlxA family with amidase domain
MSSRLQFEQDWETLAGEASFRARELAELCQISLRTLERHFQKHYSCTVSKWLRDLRLKQAYQGLLEGKAVKEVAYDTGYKQMSHFSRDFKSHFGISPSLLLPSQGNGARALSVRLVSPSEPQMIFTF